jgi:UDPglucose 6-dehydrogenase
MKSLKVCVVGCGYVGLVTGACLSEIGHHVWCVDNDHSKIVALQSGQIPIYEPGLDTLVHRNVKRKRLFFSPTLAEGMEGADVVFIAVGTPPQPDGSADLRFIDAVAQDIALHLKRYTVIAEKSTVPVQTGEEVERTIMANNKKGVPFDVVSNPEFLREGTAVQDFLKPDRIVIGTKSKRAQRIMNALYAPLKARIVQTDIKSAELIKHASNSFLATKISFMNSVAHVCELVGADARLVAEGMGLDPRIGKSFLHAGIGFGGFCLPKDLEAFHYISRQIGYEFNLLHAVKEVNEEQRKRFVTKISDAVSSLNGKTIAVLGIAFKPHTDDIRFAPSLEIINRLEAGGARVNAFDPVAMEKAKNVLKNVRFCKNAYEAAEGADCLALVTEWPDFAKLNFTRIKKSMTRAILVDGRNLYDGNKLKRLGFEYHGMGRFA